MRTKGVPQKLLSTRERDAWVAAHGGSAAGVDDGARGRVLHDEAQAAGKRRRASPGAPFCIPSSLDSNHACKRAVQVQAGPSGGAAVPNWSQQPPAVKQDASPPSAGPQPNPVVTGGCVPQRAVAAQALRRMQQQADAQPLGSWDTSGACESTDSGDQEEQGGSSIGPPTEEGSGAGSSSASDSETDSDTSSDGGAARALSPGADATALRRVGCWPWPPRICACACKYEAGT